MILTADDIPGPWCAPELAAEVREELASRDSAEPRAFTDDVRPDDAPVERELDIAAREHRELAVCARRHVAGAAATSVLDHMRNCGAARVVLVDGEPACVGCGWRFAPVDEITRNCARRIDGEWRSVFVLRGRA